VAGGVGVAPLYQLAAHLRAKGKKVHAFIGALDEGQIPIETADSGVPLSFMESADEVVLTCKEFDELGVTVGITTEQGGRGYKGFPTDLLEKYVASLRSSARRYVRVYACGPWGMMSKAAEICERQHVSCEVLLEERMGCGVGACMGCSVAVRTIDGKEGTVRKRICIDGPVFDAREVVWNG
jgi:dihydroorotate dehydrogenase electron transfer subunit